MFGAYAGAWEFPLLMVALAGLIAIVGGCVVGRWRFVRPGHIGPTVDF